MEKVTKDNLNPVLVARQRLTEKQQDKIVELHGELREVFIEMEKETDSFRLRGLAKVVKQLEFDLQEAWGFDQDSNYHSWWFQVPHCVCPVLDNFDRVGTRYGIINPECPIHGDSNE